MSPRPGIPGSGSSLCAPLVAVPETSTGRALAGGEPSPQSLQRRLTRRGPWPGTRKTRPSSAILDLQNSVWKPAGLGGREGLCREQGGPGPELGRERGRGAEREAEPRRARRGGGGVKGSGTQRARPGLEPREGSRGGPRLEPGERIPDGLRCLRRPTPPPLV